MRGASLPKPLSAIRVSGRWSSAYREGAVCPATPEPFIAIGLHDGNLDQVDDAEVLALLQRT